MSEGALPPTHAQSGECGGINVRFEEAIQKAGSLGHQLAIFETTGAPLLACVSCGSYGSPHMFGL